MGFLKKSNNAKTTLVSKLNASATTLVVSSASDFPTSGDFLVTIWNKDTYPDPSDDSSMEIVKVTGVSGNNFTIVRGQEDTSGQTHLSGHAVELLITAGHFTEIENAIPENLADLNEDSTHRVVTDTEKSTWNAKQDALGFTPEDSANKGTANGYAGLDSGGKVPIDQLPTNLMQYKGAWNASTNTPTLADGIGTTGDFYRVNVAGTQDLGSGSITFNVGDYVAYNGSTWEKLDATDIVTSVAGKTGDVTLDNSDVGLGNVPNLDTTDAVNNEHTHSNKSELDLISDGDHDIRTDNPHLVDKTDVGLSNVDNVSEVTIISDVKLDSDVADALSKRHTQNTDIILKDSLNNDVINDATLKNNLSVDNAITIDGRDLSVDGTKLDGIESGAEVNTVDSVNGETGVIVLTQDNIGDGSTYKQYSATEKTKLAGIEESADVTDATNVDNAGAVMESDYNANTILVANLDNTPTVLELPNDTILGRITGNNISALTASNVRSLISVEENAVALTTVKADADISSAISLKHTQNTDTQLDSGVIHIDAQNNVSCFYLESIDDGVDGKSFTIYRNANEGLDYFGFYFDKARNGIITSSSNLVFVPSTNVTFYQNSVQPFISYGSSAVNNTLILKEGNVGIGTDNPSQALDIIGSIELENTLSSSTGIIYKGSDTFIHNFQHPTGNTAVPGGWNTFIGIKAGNLTMGATATETYHGSYNVAVGYESLIANTIGFRNIAVGYQSLYSNTEGYRNVAVGSYSLYANTTGYRNTGIGHLALRENTSGYQNISLGAYALRYNQTGNDNIAIGVESCGYGSESVNSLSNNVVIGSFAGYNLTIGSNNILLGYKSGENLTIGTKNIIIGYDIDSPAVDNNNILNIGNLLFGVDLDGSDTTLSSGCIGIGLTTPTAKLHIQVANLNNKETCLIEQLDITNNPICVELNNDGTNHGLYLHQDGNLATGKYSVFIDGTAIAQSQPLVEIDTKNDANNTGSGIRIYNRGAGHGLYILQSRGLISTKASLNIISNVNQTVGQALAFISEQGVNSTIPVIEIDNDGTGYALNIHQDGILASATQGVLIYSNAAQTNSGVQLVRIEMDNSASTKNVCFLENQGTGNALFITQAGNGIAAEINNDGTNHGLYIHQDGNLATGKYAIYVDNNGTPADGAGRAIRFDGCVVSSTKDPTTDTNATWLGVNLDGTQYAIPVYALS